MALIVAVSLNSATMNVAATDLVPTDDLSGGASVFVFRSSRKKPQERGGGAAGLRGGASAYRAQDARLNAQFSASRRKKAANIKSRQAEIVRAQARERNAKIKLSNTLTTRGNLAMEKGDVSLATTNYRAALKNNPKNSYAASGLSEALTVTGIETAGESNNEAAIPILEEAVKLDSKNASAFAKLGQIYDTKGTADKALLNYEKALTLDPEFTTLYIPAGLASVDTGDFVKAETYFTKADAAGVDSSEARFARVSIMVKQNKNTEALAALERIIRTEPQNGEAYYHRGVIYAVMNQPSRSIDAYKEAIRIDPTNSLAWFDLGVIYYNSEDYKNAEKAYKESLRIDAGNTRTHANLASTYRQQERYAEANAEYKLAEPGNTKNAELYSEWGYCLGKTNEWDKAVAKLETARSLNPDAVDANNVGWAYYNAARADKAANRDAEAAAKLQKSKASLQQAVKYDPAFDAAYMNLGATHNGLGEYDAAVTSLNEANRLHPDWVIAINQLGTAYRGKKDLTSALAQFNRVVTLDGNNVMGLFNLGSTQYATGDKKGAKKTQDKLKKLNPQLAENLGGIIAGKIVDEAGRQIRKAVRIPGFPF
ncbi:MAG: tetratricopeptide repeat protein [Acidobacteriota bacterium]